MADPVPTRDHVGPVADIPGAFAVSREVVGLWQDSVGKEAERLVCGEESRDVLAMWRRTCAARLPLAPVEPAPRRGGVDSPRFENAMLHLRF